LIVLVPDAFEPEDPWLTFVVSVIALMISIVLVDGFADRDPSVSVPFTAPLTLT
jgi:hypothetical protein